MFLDLARLMLFPALMAFAAASDLLTMTISNRVSLALAAGFLALATASGMGAYDILMHVGAGAAVLTIGQGLKFVIDRGFGAGSGPELDRALAFSFAVVFVMAVATYARFYFVSWLGERVTADLRRAAGE